MPGSPPRTSHKDLDASDIHAFARTVIASLKVSQSPHALQMIEEASDWLADAVLSRETPSLEDLRAGLEARKMASTDVIDYCVPKAAAKLGLLWANNKLSFVSVSAGSARLQLLCRLVSSDWEHSRVGERLDLLSVTMPDEQHLIGQAVTADQLRRKGHSVKILTNADYPSLRRELKCRGFDAVLMSCATTKSLEAAVEMISNARGAEGPAPLFLLGGAVLEHVKAEELSTGADLVTNDINDALSRLKREPETRLLRVAE